MKLPFFNATWCFLFFTLLSLPSATLHAEEPSKADEKKQRSKKQKIKFEFKNRFQGSALILMGDEVSGEDVLRRNRGELQFELQSKLKVKLNKQTQIRAEVELDERGVDVEEFILKREFPETNQTVRAGYQKRFYLSSKTTQISPLDLLVLGVEDPSVIWNYSPSWWQVSTSLHRGGRVDDRRATEDKASAADRLLGTEYNIKDRDDSDFSGGFMLGIHTPQEKKPVWEGALELFYEARPRRPSSDATINKTKGAGTEFEQANGSDDNRLLGASIDWRWANASGQTVIVQVGDRGLQRLVQRHDLELELESWAFLVSYSALEMEVPYVKALPLTWDRQKVIGGVHWKSASNNKWILEYASNQEQSNVHNDDLLVRYQLKF